MRKIRLKKEKVNKIRLLISLSLFIFILIVSSNYVSAYNWVCLKYGQSVPNDEEPRYTCKKDYCRLCVTDNLYPTSFSKCNDLTTCTTFDDGNIDVEPPQLNVNSPIDNNVYNTRKVLFDINSDEPVTISYVDNIFGRGRWKKLQSLTRNYNRYISFDDGLNDITIKAVDKNGNSIDVIKKFFVDSKKPNIKETFPKEGFVGGEFIVEYNEENVKEIKLYYGIENNMKQTTLTNCLSGENKQCTVNVNLQEFNEQEIEYWFSLEDISGNIDNSKKVKLTVDYSAPVIKNLEYTKNGRNLKLKLEFEENFLDKILYKYDIRGKEKVKKICPRLDNGVCNDILKLSDGEQTLTFVIVDKAGNEATKTQSFVIDSISPKIKSVSPLRGFANGLFELEFIEENVKEIVFMYGNEEMKSVKVNINECNMEGKVDFCSVNVNLNDFNNKEIKFWFEIEDVSGNKEKSKEIMMSVDNQPPVLMNENFWEIGDRREVIFNFEVLEENFDEITYIDNSDKIPKEKRLCSSLKNGKCSVKKRFRKGQHILDIIISDGANAISKRIEFDIK